VVSVTDPYGRILGFLDRSRYFSEKKVVGLERGPLSLVSTTEEHLIEM
jgi:hypothetical protein